MRSADLKRFQRRERLFNGPAWRWRIADRLSEQDSVRRGDADETTRRAAEFLARESRGISNEERSASDQEIAQARALWNDAAFSDCVRLLAIAGVPQSQIAARLGVEEPLIALVELLFFDVRRSLRASAWIASRVFAPLNASGRSELVARLRFAYSGGPAAAEALLDAAVNFPTTDSDRLLDRESRLSIKLQAALDAPVADEATRVAFAKMALDYMLKSERLKLDREKFAARQQRESRARKPVRSATSLIDGHSPERPAEVASVFDASELPADVAPVFDASELPADVARDCDAALAHSHVRDVFPHRAFERALPDAPTGSTPGEHLVA